MPKPSGIKTEASRLRNALKGHGALLDVRNRTSFQHVVYVDLRYRDTDGEECWRAEGTDIDGHRITAIVVAYQDEEAPEIKIITTWAQKPKMAIKPKVPGRETGTCDAAKNAKD